MHREREWEKDQLNSFVKINYCIWLESISLPKSDIKSLDFIFNRFLMKLFKATDIKVVTNCQRYSIVQW